MASKVSKTSNPPGVLGKHPRTESQSDPDEPKAKVRKVVERSYNWFLTWNNYDAESIVTLLNLAQVKKYCIQEEVGKDGTPHLQGVMVFKTNVSWTGLNNACEKKCWWKRCRNVAAAVNYCSKVETSAGKRWVEGFRVPGQKLIDPLEGKVLYPWQKEIIEMISEMPDDRKVFWYWSDAGCVGKSSLIKHLCLKDPKGIVMCGGGFKDAEYCIAQKVKKEIVVKVVIFNVPRSKVRDGKALVSYTGIEEIKDGCFFSAKYESGMVLMDPPHVLVFANVAPDTSQLSADRWVIKCLDKDGDPYSYANRRSAYMETSESGLDAGRIELPTLEEVSDLD